MIDRPGLYKEINLEIQKNLINRKWSEEICRSLYVKHKIPPEITSDILTKKTDLQDALDVVLYCIATELQIYLPVYYTASEISRYEDYQYQTSSVTFPYIFEDMIEISEGKQYIGKITVQQLMQLRDAQILNYNANTQRQMQLKTGNNFSYFRIALNRKAVDQITNLLNTGDFIPNTITLNINPAVNFSYSNGKLRIKDEVKFDILDGYHRYIALSNLYNLNKTFDYPMELRITFFREEVARQFIFQEDQKTKLAKVDSAAMDKNNISNKICREILEILKDRFNASDIVRQGVLSKIISVLYIEKGKAYPYQKIIAVAEEITNAIKRVCLDVNSFLSTPWSDTFTVMFVTLIKHGELKGKQLYDKATELSENIKATELKIDTLTISKLNKLLSQKGGEQYVIQ